MFKHECESVLHNSKLRNKVAGSIGCDCSSDLVDKKILEMIDGFFDILIDAQSDKEVIQMLIIRVGMKIPDPKVIEFIDEFKQHTNGGEEILVNLFTTGYCWHFAHLLKTTFRGEGEVCWCAPYAHFVWVYKDVPYDINGVTLSEADYFIPEHYLCSTLLDFIHRPGEDYDVSQEDISSIIERYAKSLADSRTTVKGEHACLLNQN